MTNNNHKSVGVLGLGGVAEAHIETWKQVEGANITAVSSRRELKESRLQNQYGIPITAYEEYQSMLQDDSIDIIDICTPSQYHAQQAIKAARAGKDIVLEKPIATTWNDAKKLQKVLEEEDTKVSVCFEIRFSQQAETLKSTISQELIGDLHYAEVDYYHGIGPEYSGASWIMTKEGGGSSLLAAGCHALDLLLWYFDSPVEEVVSFSTNTSNEDFDEYEYDTTTSTLIKFANGNIGKVASVIDCNQPYYFRMHLIGSDGTILDDKFYSKKIAGLDEGQWSQFGVPVVDSGAVEHHPYLPQFQAFVEALSEGNAPPRTNFETALESHKVIFAADKSTEEGRPVKMSEFD